MIPGFVKVGIGIVGGAVVLCVLIAFVFAAWQTAVPSVSVGGYIVLFAFLAIVLALIGAAGFWKFVNS